MSRATSASSGKSFGLAWVWRVWDMAHSTVYWNLQLARRRELGGKTDQETLDPYSGLP